MQDRYAGDIGDFSKFALARILGNEIGGQIGVIWYRFPDEVHNNDGRHVEYLAKPEWIKADKVLIQQLRKVISSGRRRIIDLEQSRILPVNTVFFDEPVHSNGDPAWSRSRWFQNAIGAVSGCNLAIVDPDNGIAGPNYAPNGVRGGKHITLEEITRLANQHSCLMIYHHFDRSASHEVQIGRQVERIQPLVPGHNIVAVRYSRFSPRVYLIVYQDSVSSAIDRSLDVIRNAPWDFHFSIHHR
ncbi:MAG: hypothetical protein WCG75_05280 [Armatimonadota bacterium]